MEIFLKWSAVAAIISVLVFMCLWANENPEEVNDIPRLDQAYYNRALECQQYCGAANGETPNKCFNQRGGFIPISYGLCGNPYSSY